MTTCSFVQKGEKTRKIRKKITSDCTITDRVSQDWVTGWLMGKKIGRRISSGKKARKVRGAFGGVGRVLANSNPVFPKEKSVMGCKIGHSDVAEILLSAITSKNDPEFEGLHAQWKHQLEEERKERKALSRLMAVSTGNYDITLLSSGSKVGDGYLLGAETYETKDDRFGRSQVSRKLHCYRKSSCGYS